MKSSFPLKMSALLLAAFVLLTWGVSRGADAIRVGYFDLNDVIKRCEAGKRAQEEMSKLLSGEKKEMGKYEDEFIEKKNEFDRKSLLWDKGVREQKQRDLEELWKQLQERRREAQKKITKGNEKLTAPILRNVEEIVVKIGKTKGYALIFEKSRAGIIYAPSALDLTDQIIKDYNQIYEKEKAKEKKRK